MAIAMCCTWVVNLSIPLKARSVLCLVSCISFIICGGGCAAKPSRESPEGLRITLIIFWRVTINVIVGLSNKVLNPVNSDIAGSVSVSVSVVVGF